ncbi:site-specific integrase [Halorussus salinus]|uniref:site-specific integrase n=1 Tax=Halorussus salinus TaxID=1364935 RepID=UPI001092A811|nr:site-specific integrase [Halorussus salinus]
MNNESEFETQRTNISKQNGGDKRSVETTYSIQLVPDFFREEYSHRQVVDLEDHYHGYVVWLREQGKNPDEDEGIASSNVPIVFSRTVQFHRRVWEQLGKYTTRFTHEHADEYEQDLKDDNVTKESGEPYVESSKRKLQEAVVKYFLWVSWTKGGEPWKPSLTFSQSDFQQSDYFTLEEREALYEAALTYDDLGRYSDLSPEARERQKGYLAQKLGKPKSDVTPDDFEQCRRSWEIPSLISASLDLGPRPKLIERCLLKWYKPAKGEFQIPKEGAVKNDQYWNNPVSSRTLRLLDRWEKQRSSLHKYDESEHLWLNREGNPYSSKTLNYLLDNLLEEAGIGQANRRLTWTSIRRSTGTYLAYVEGLHHAKCQLRHMSMQATLVYVEIPVEAYRDALDQLTVLSETNSADGHPLSGDSSVPMEVLQNQ